MSWRLKRTKHLIVLAVSLAVAFVTTARADIINVPRDFPTIQEAIDAALDGDEVVVAPGEYFENINFLAKAITVRSTDPTDPATVVSTIINGGGSGSVVTCTSGEGPDTVLSGFVITGGNATFGGGMSNFESSPTVTNCTFSGNTAGGIGGGMFNNASSPTVTNCTFSNNTGENIGGGMFNADSSPTVTNCTFSNNTAEFGGGMLNECNSSPTVINCTFSGNTASSGGGGMLNIFSSPTVTNCQICANTPDQIIGSFTDGGGNFVGLYCPPPTPECPGDLDGNDNVGVSDLLALLANWGPCP